MSRFGADYHVARPTGVCASSGEPLPVGARCVATLCERPDDEGFDRLDFAQAAWDAGERPDGLFSHWSFIVPEPNERRRLFVDDAVLQDLFERLADDDRPQRVAFRFVLALILMRKRLLRFVGRRETGADEFWQFRPRGAPPELPPIEVVNPRLTDDDVRELTDQLSEVLQSEL